MPWGGRSFEQGQATTDDGSADPALLASLIAFGQGTVDQVTVIDAVRASRLLVPLLAHAGEVGETPDGHLVDKTQELSIATVQAPDGRAVLPAFSSVQTMSAWNARARPVPAVGPRIALAAASEQTELVVIDPTTPTEFVLRRPAVKALATGAPWTPPWQDDAVITAFSEATRQEEAVQAVTLSAGDPTALLRGPELEVVLALRPGLDRDSLDIIVARLTSAWAASALIADRVDSMTLRVRSAG
ncbi:SseB family protein [Humibacter antri]